MRVISHPMRLDSAGAIVTIDDTSARAAAELTGHVISCLAGERTLSPLYGVRDPSGQGVSPSAVARAIAVCEPELTARAVTITDAGSDTVRVQVDVEWSQQ